MPAPRPPGCTQRRDRRWERAARDFPRGGGRDAPGRRCRRADGMRRSKLDHALLAPRARRGFGELERFDSIVDRRLHRFAFGDRLEKMRHLVGVGAAVALQEKMLGLVVAYAGLVMQGHLGRLVVARLQHALASQYLEALVVTVCGAATGVD